MLRQAFVNTPYDRGWEPSAFVQDSWRATDHLTFNLGLRYDVFTKFNEKNKNFANFDLASLTLIDNATGNVANVYTDFSPRLGFDATIASGDGSPRRLWPYVLRQRLDQHGRPQQSSARVQLNWRQPRPDFEGRGPPP